MQIFITLLISFLLSPSLVAAESNYPLLIHCVSANRVGMVWAAYQLENGVEYHSALMESRTIGMKPEREQQLVQNLSHFVAPSAEK